MTIGLIEVEMVHDKSRRGNYPAPAHSFALRLDDELALRLIERHHAHEHYRRIDAEREHLGRWLSWTREPTPEAVYDRIARSLGRFAQGDGWRADLCWRSEPVGSIWLHGLNGSGGSTEIGYWLAAEHQGKGLVTRTMRALMRHFFEGRGLGRVSVGLDPRNERSLKVVKRLELEPEAILRRVHVDVDGASSDLAMFGLLREDWEARQPGSSRGALPLPRFCLEVDADEDLYLGLFERDDAEPLAALVAANAEHLRPWLPWVDDSGPEAQLAFITGRALQAIAANAGFEAGIWSRGRLVGAAGVHSVDERSRSGMIGYWLAEPAQGNGIVTRVVRVMAERCFSERLFADGPFERLEIAADALNLRSRAVAERLGFTFEGVLRRQPFGAKGFVDLAIYGVLRSEWEALGADVTTSPLGPVSESSATMAAVRGKGTTMDSEHQTDRQPGGDVPFGERRVSERRVDERRADERRPTGERPAGERKRRDDEPRPGSEAALDEALDETYPASDPPSHDAPHTEQRRRDLEQREEREENLDDALDDTFPASDPVSQNMPHRGKADDE